MHTIISLGIETSCDETSVAFVTDQKEILSHTVFSQKDHEAFGGVVPELAARSHLQNLEQIFKETQKKTGLSVQDVSVIAATCGPGLIGGVIVGSSFAKGLAYYHNKPFIPVNHLEAHALTVRLTEKVEFPYLLLLVSGGHCQLVCARDLGQYSVLGSTKDDAVGETFDKVAKLLGLGYPGGPAIEKAACQGEAQRFSFPRPFYGQAHCSFSFSGLKTAVRYEMQKNVDPSAQDICDCAASFQKAVSETLVDRVQQAMQQVPSVKKLVVAGGVGANQQIRTQLQKLCVEKSWAFYAPPNHLCTDNGAMVAWTGLEYFIKGKGSDLNFAPRPRWPLSELG